MRKPKKPPVKAKGGGGKGGSGSGKPPGWKSGHHHKGIVPHHPIGHHHPHAPHKKRKLSPGADVACCSAEAVGLLLGWGWDEVLALYWRTASDPDAGATIADTLAAAPARCRLQTRSFGIPSLLLGPPRAGAALILGVT